MKKIAIGVWSILGLVLLVPACSADADDLPPVYMCQGKALACGSRTMAQCTLGADCHVGGTCGGTPAYCGGLSDAECLSQRGCTLSFIDAKTRMCMGVPKPCADQTSEFDCTDMKGCSWTEACVGDKAPSCVAVSQAKCKLVPGCAWTRAN